VSFIDVLLSTRSCSSQDKVFSAALSQRNEPTPTMCKAESGANKPQAENQEQIVHSSA
jgi:hypothetical protein